VAVALYNLGDEIHPRDVSPQDISMTEEVGEAAEERRRKAREELMQRRAVLQARRKQSSSTMTSFDSLVDEEGRLRSETLDGLDPMAHSTALDTGDSKAVLRHGQPGPDGLTEGRLQAQRELLDAMDRDRLHLTLPSETASHHPSESLVDLTPTSEFPETDAGASVHSIQSPHEPLAQSEYFSTASQGSSNHSEADFSEFYYAHPDPPAQAPSNPFHHPADRDISSTSSVAGSLSHIRAATDASSDGTLSEWGHATDGIATPASWSEIGSEVSSDDDHHH
jgi:hypothetical protein